MGKIIAILFIFTATFSFSQSPTQSLEIHDNIISAGYGFPYLPSITFSEYINEPEFKSKTTGPYYLKLEHIFSDDISFGINLAYAANKGSYFEKINQYNSTTGSTSNVSYLHQIDRETFSVLFRANWYFANDRNFYAYFGGGLGYRYVKWTITSTNPSYENETYPNYFPFGLEMTIGAKYLFSDIIAVYGELGFAKSPIQIGICLILGSEEPEDRKIRR